MDMLELLEYHKLALKARYTSRVKALFQCNIVARGLYVFSLIDRTEAPKTNNMFDLIVSYKSAGIM